MEPLNTILMTGFGLYFVYKGWFAFKQSWYDLAAACWIFSACIILLAWLPHIL